MEQNNKKFMAQYNRCLAKLQEDPRGYVISHTTVCNDTGIHPYDYRDYECGFAARHIKRLNPANILDIGSHRFFLLGVLAAYPITTIDVRDRKPFMENETVVTCDAKQLSLPDNSFDMVLSLCAIEHFGLGRYGDEFDLDADRKAFHEMVRVLKKDGRILFTTTITRGAATIDFNAHRIYTCDMLRELCRGLVCEEERFYSHGTGDFCSLEEVTSQPNVWDIYCGCWKKP